MPRLSANLNFLFNEVPFMERFEAAAKAGFQYVEFMFPYDFDQSEIKKQLELHGLTIGLFNLPAGNWDGGDRGVAADPNRRNEFKEGVPKAIEAAKCFNVSRVNCLVGKVAGEQEEARVVENIQENILYAAEEFAKVGLNLMIEPVNHYDIPGFYLNTTAQVMEIIHKVNRPNVFLQYDIYHAEREGEDHDMILQNLFSKIGHIQIADNPGRNQPGTGVIPCKALLDKIDQLGYQGTIGLEYRPTGKTEDSLGWVKEYGYSLK